MRKSIIGLLIIILFLGCTPRNISDQPTLSVSIEPLKFIVEQIAGNDFSINVLVPPGASPETYEPTATQMREMAGSKAYLSIGLIDFEYHLDEMITKNMPEVVSVQLSKGIDLIEGNCGHTQHHAHNDHSGHHHGTDPHLWLSLRCVKQMAGNATRLLMDLYPDSVKYQSNYQLFAEKIDNLDNKLSSLFSEDKTGFLIFHPALTYYARDYGLTQIAIEEDGKEPSAEHIRHLIEEAKNLNITKIFYQSQFSRSTVDALTKELNIKAVPFDPLATNILENIEWISNKS